MTEEITLNGESILDGYEGNNGELSDNEETHEETQPRKISLHIPEIKSPQFNEMLTQIKEYKRIFPEQCKNVCIKNENKLTEDDLLNKIEECKIATAGRNPAHKVGFKFGLGLLEQHIAPAYGFDLRGLTNTAIQAEDLMLCLDELALSRSWTTKYIPPETRLLLGIGEIAYRVHAANTLAKTNMNMPQNKEKYDDL
jgi:hypothetical protein